MPRRGPSKKEPYGILLTQQRVREANLGTRGAPSKAVLFAIASFAKPDGSSAFPSLKALATAAGLSVRGLHGVLERLEDNGLLHVDRSGGGRRRPHFYDLNLEALAALANKPVRNGEDAASFSITKGASPASIGSTTFPETLHLLHRNSASAAPQQTREQTREHTINGDGDSNWSSASSEGEQLLRRFGVWEDRAKTIARDHSNEVIRAVVDCAKTNGLGPALVVAALSGRQTDLRLNDALESAKRTQGCRRKNEARRARHEQLVEFAEKVEAETGARLLEVLEPHSRIRYDTLPDMLRKVERLADELDEHLPPWTSEEDRVAADLENAAPAPARPHLPLR